MAEHARQTRKHQVVMQPEHYAGLLRVDRTLLQLTPPQYDPRYPRSSEVAVRDLSIYEELTA